MAELSNWRILIGGQSFACCVVALMVPASGEPVGYSVPAQYGYIECYYRFFGACDRLLVVERWATQRWMILYRLEWMRWVCYERHIVCKPLGVHRRLESDGSPWLLFGVIVEGDSSCAAIECRGSCRYLMLFDGNEDSSDGALLEEIELMDCMDVDTGAHELVQGNSSATSTVDRFPHSPGADDVQIISSKDEHIAFVTAGMLRQKKLLMYSWDGRGWNLSLVFRVVLDEEKKAVTECREQIMDVYIGIRQQVLVRLVVEAGSYLRWWHWCGEILDLIGDSKGMGS